MCSYNKDILFQDRGEMGKEVGGVKELGSQGVEALRSLGVRRRYMELKADTC